MVRTQIYLTENQPEELAAIAKAVGKKQSELIREAIDRLIDFFRGHVKAEAFINTCNARIILCSRT